VTRLVTATSLSLSDNREVKQSTMTMLLRQTIFATPRVVAAITAPPDRRHGCAWLRGGDRRPPREAGGNYQIVDGERRLRAWRRSTRCAGTIPVRVVALTDDELRQGALRGNLLHRPLGPWAAALALTQLRDMGMTAAEIAAYVGQSEAWVRLRLGLLALEGPLREAAIVDPDSLILLGTVALLAAEEREDLFTRLAIAIATAAELAAVVAAKRRGLRRLEHTVPDGT
jgi:ParB-like chromosome segregation protein Spo0J